MQKSSSVSRNSSSCSSNNNNSNQQHQKSVGRISLCTQVSSSPLVFPEKRSRKTKALLKTAEVMNNGAAVDKANRDELVLDFGEGVVGGGGGDEKSDLLGCVVFSGKLVLDKRKSISVTDGSTAITDIKQQNSTDVGQDAVDASLTTKAIVWDSNMLYLDDVISVSYNVGLRHFTVHSYPIKSRSCCFSCFFKPKRSRKDYQFLASSVEDAIKWVGGFADQQCYVNCLPHPLASSKKQASSELIPTDTPPELLFKCKCPPKFLVILNPRSGCGRSSKVFHGIAEPIFKLAGFRLEVVKTTSAGHARNLASTVDFSTCPDGIICVGGDGIINEVLNGLLSRENQKEGISLPIGIIPAGSDNSLVWTVLSVRDPISAAISIVKGGLTATDVFAVEWIQTGVLHFGMTVSYYGFVSDVLQLSEKYQKHFGPLRYFVAGFLKFLCLPKYSYEVEYVPAMKENQDGKPEAEAATAPEVYVDMMEKSKQEESLPRASSLSSIDSMATGSGISGTSGDVDSTETSEYVRGLDPVAKRLSLGRNNATAETEVIRPQPPLAGTPNWPRTRSKSRADKGWTGLTAIQVPARSSRGNDGEEISSTLSDPGPIWDAEPKWDADATWDVENPIELPGPTTDPVHAHGAALLQKVEDRWEFRKGQFLGILVCNHACRTVQSSQVVAPRAEHDDNSMDLILVHGNGRLRLLRFFLLLQRGRHLSLPYVEYIKVKSVKIKAGKKTHNGCGIDGELFPLHGQVISTMLPEQCRLIGRSVHRS